MPHHIWRTEDPMPRQVHRTSSPQNWRGAHGRPVSIIKHSASVSERLCSIQGKLHQLTHTGKPGSLLATSIVPRSPDVHRLLVPKFVPAAWSQRAATPSRLRVGHAATPSRQLHSVRLAAAVLLEAARTICRPAHGSCGFDEQATGLRPDCIMTISSIGARGQETMLAGRRLRSEGGDRVVVGRLLEDVRNAERRRAAAVVEPEASVRLGALQITRAWTSVTSEHHSRVEAAYDIGCWRPPRRLQMTPQEFDRDRIQSLAGK